MGHNLTNRKRASMALNAPASDWSGRLLEVTCRHADCERISHFDAAGLLGYCRAPTLGAVLPRLRCRSCGRAPDTVRLIITSGTERVPEVVALVGPGSM